MTMEPKQAEKQQVEADAKNDAIKDEKAETEYEKLKSQNDEFEKELIKSREMKAEAQKLEAEKQLGGESGGHVENKPPEISDEEYSKKALAGEIDDKKEE